MREELTLEKLVELETERKSNRIATTNGHIQKLTARKSRPGTSAFEKQRLQRLIELHQNFLAELEAVDINETAAQRFSKQQEISAKMKRPGHE